MERQTALKLEGSALFAPLERTAKEVSICTAQSILLLTPGTSIWYTAS